MIDDLAPTEEPELDIQEGMSLHEVLGDEWSYHQGGPDMQMAEAHEASFGQPEHDENAEQKPEQERELDRSGAEPGPDNNGGPSGGEIMPG